MIRIMSTSKANLFFNESENKFYSEDPKVIVKALHEDCISSCVMVVRMANAVKQMIKDADGRIHKLPTDNLSVHIVRITIS